MSDEVLGSPCSQGKLMLRRITTAERLFSYGQQLAAQHQYEAAGETFTQALTLRPRTAGIALHQALALAETGQVAAAVDRLQEALLWQPKNPVLPLFMAQLWFDAADYGQAKHWCARTLAMAPHNPYALGLQALIDLARGQIPQAYARLTQPLPLPLTPAERLALRLSKSRPPSLLQLANTALSSRLLLWVETFLLQHDIPARTLSQQLVDSTPTTPAWHGLALLDRFCTRGVIGVQRLAIHLRYAGRPTTRSLWLQQADAEEAYYLGEVSTARERYTQLLQHEPADDLARQRLVDVCYEQGDFHAALAHLQAIVPHDAALSPWHASLLGELLCQVGRYTEAIAALRQAVQHGLYDFKPYYYLGVCQLRQGAHLQARRWFAQAVQWLNPGITSLRCDEMYRVYTHSVPHPLR